MAGEEMLIMGGTALATALLANAARKEEEVEEGGLVFTSPSVCFSTDPKYGCKTVWSWSLEPVTTVSKIVLYALDVGRNILCDRIELVDSDGRKIIYVVNAYSRVGAPLSITLNTRHRNIAGVTVVGLVPISEHPRGNGYIEVYS